jgi:hypothetical protein
MKKALYFLPLLIPAIILLSATPAQTLPASEWKTISESHGYTIKLPKDFTDGGIAASGIHYFNGGNLSIETNNLPASVKPTDELSQAFAISSKDFDNTAYDMVLDELKSDYYILIIKDKDGNTYYEKSIAGDHCIYTLKFDIGPKDAKRMSDYDANLILESFTVTEK